VIGSVMVGCWGAFKGGNVILGSGGELFPCEGWSLLGKSEWKV
jgi:hypothetical protein